MSQPNTSLETSFTKLFGQQIPDLPVIERIEIPLIQRDYAQGRPGGEVKRIRDCFLDALCTAIRSGGAAIKLDFIYGDVVNGAFYPLDGQQRLTTLFLLHWYLAWRSEIPTEKEPWTQFTYATRPGARQFCEHLAESSQPSVRIEGEKGLSGWLTDQAWYLYTWEHDPTIQSMLVMLDAMHDIFRGFGTTECIAAWQRLTNVQQPAIVFYLLPMAANKLTDDLYIKMNSRGKPLTAFENFKAHFVDVLKAAHTEEIAAEFAKKVDTQWADTLWCYRGDDTRGWRSEPS